MFLLNLQQGCYAICNHNCEACEIIVESNTISSIAAGGKKVSCSYHFTVDIYRVFFLTGPTL